MKTKFILTLASAFILAGLIIACNKSNSTTNGNNPGNSSQPNTSVTQIQTQADDESQVSTELNNAEDDINNSLNASAAFNGASTTSTTNGVVTDGGVGGLILDLSICDATVTTDTANGQRELIITYNGANCKGNRIRTGVITVSIPIGTRWKDKGAVVTVNIANLKITRVRDHKSITINGIYTFTNVTGGLRKTSLHSGPSPILSRPAMSPSSSPTAQPAPGASQNNASSHITTASSSRQPAPTPTAPTATSPSGAQTGSATPSRPASYNPWSSNSPATGVSPAARPKPSGRLLPSTSPMVSTLAATPQAAPAQVIITSRPYGPSATRPTPLLLRTNATL